MAAASILSAACSYPRRHPAAPHLSHSARFKRFDRVRRFSPAAMSTPSGPKEAPGNNPGLHTEIDPATKGYFLQQTMLRVKDPKMSLDFYSRVMGMSLLKRLDFEELKFSLYFLGYEDVASAPADHIKRTEWTFRQKATLELTHNWGTESDPEFKGYHNGNSDPRGFGHIGVTVDDVYKACERFERLGVDFVKKPDDDHGVNEGEPVDEQCCEQVNEDPIRDPEPEGQDFPEGFEDEEDPDFVPDDAE